MSKLHWLTEPIFIESCGVDYIRIYRKGLSMAINMMYDEWKLLILAKYQYINVLFMPSMDK